MLSNSNFAHLHIHNEYSQLDGFGSGDTYARIASEMGFKYLALTNHGNIDGCIDWQRSCKKYGIKPIMGCEMYIVPFPATEMKKGYFHITLLVKNKTGWINLCKMLSYANLHGFYYKPRIDFATLLKHCEGLVVLTGCAQSFLMEQKNDGIELLFDLYDKIGEDVYFEVMPHCIEVQEGINQACLHGWENPDIKIKVVATNDCHYPEADDWEVQEVMLAIQRDHK